jgi:enoyl-CoA hydratase/carnithine racemase
MVNAVASRVIPRQRISKVVAKGAAAEAARMKELAQRADAPLSVARIPSRVGDDFKMANVVLRPMGNSRRIFLMDPHLDSEELEGLAHRIHALSNNEAINSVLIASDDQDDASTNCLPRYVTELDNPKFGLNMDFDPSPGSTWHVAGGYNPLKVLNDQEQNRYCLDSLRKLALATKGDDSGKNSTRVPVITMPHGIVTDGGYALCMGGYVVATRQTSFRILNPSRGLSFDPVGFSYILPRLGWENQQRSAKYRGCGLLLALAGYEANCFDMVETDLATHLVSDSSVLPLLEENLASIPPWNQQRLVTNPPRLYGKKAESDPNARFRNKTIAYVIEQLSEHSSSSSNSLPYDFTVTNAVDPALDIDHVPWDSGFFSSNLVDTAALFDVIFKDAKSVDNILELLREAGDKKSNDVDDQENSRIAKDLVARMESQSPLALHVVFQLMKLGRRAKSTMETCMELELNAQLEMFKHSDFKEWAAHVRKHGGEHKAPEFGGWKHKSVKDVTQDEVDAIVQDRS